MSTERTIARAAALACRLEAEAPKPGNVTPRDAFPEMGYEDLLASAGAIAPVMGMAGSCAVGETILKAVQATREVAGVNTNLGMVLLLAPLARAAAIAGMSGAKHDERRTALRSALAGVLRDLDVADAEHAYRAIRLAAPGGMGRVPSQDLSGSPSVSLLEAMRVAADRDLIAREYVTDFEVTFERGLPLLEEAFAAGLAIPEAIVDLFLELLVSFPDTLLARKFGRAAAEQASARAASALAAGPRGSAPRATEIELLDRWLRHPSRRWNPGTTADIVAATLFVWLLTTQRGAELLAPGRRLSLDNLDNEVRTCASSPTSTSAPAEPSHRRS